MNNLIINRGQSLNNYYTIIQSLTEQIANNQSPINGQSYNKSRTIFEQLSDIMSLLKIYHSNYLNISHIIIFKLLPNICLLLLMQIMYDLSYIICKVIYLLHRLIIDYLFCHFSSFDTMCFAFISICYVFHYL